MSFLLDLHITLVGSLVYRVPKMLRLIECLVDARCLLRLPHLLFMRLRGVRIIRFFIVEETDLEKLA